MVAAAKRVAIVSLNPWTAGTMSASFNFASRRLHAALRSDPRLSACEVRVFEHGAIPLSQWADTIAEFEPDVLAASAYVWSLPTFTLLAQEVKRRSPECLTIVGGPSARVEMLSLAPFRAAAKSIDVLVLGEGEHVLCELVANYGHGVGTFDRIPGLALHSPLGWRKTVASTHSLAIDDLPSPYRMGLVPPSTMAYLETFRGCPMSCTFCQWGDLDPAGGVLSADALVQEFEAMETLGPVGIAMTDAALNLNSRAFKNLAEAARRTGFLEDRYFDTEMYPALLKPAHLDFLAPTHASVGLGLQTATQSVLDRVDRRFKRKHFTRVVEDLAQVSTVTVEVILGLPGDSIEGFRETLRVLEDLPCNVRAYHCLVLPDAFMTREGTPEELDFHPITLELRSAPGWSERDLAEAHEWLDEISNSTRTTLSSRAPVGDGDVLEGYVEQVVDPPWWAVSHNGSARHRDGASRGSDGRTYPHDVDARALERRIRAMPPHLGSGAKVVSAIYQQASERVQKATRGLCTVNDVRVAPHQVVVSIAVGGANFELYARPPGPDTPSFRETHGCSYVYRADSGQLSPRHEAIVVRTIEALGQPLAPLVLGAPQSSV